MSRNCLLRDVIEGQMAEVKGVDIRTIQLLDDLKNRKRYWELKEESKDKVGYNSLLIEHMKQIYISSISP
jgi:hypothetical protein